MGRLLIFQLFTQLAIGGAWTLLLVPLKEAGHSFFRLCGILVAVLLAIAIWAGPYPMPGLSGLIDLQLQAWTETLILLSAVAMLAHVRAVGSGLLPWDRRFLYLSALAGAVALVGDGLLLRPPQASFWWESLLLPTFYLASSLFLGSICFTMILGHWYLVSPALSIRPFLRATRLILGSLTAKIILFGAALLLYSSLGDPVHQQTVRAFLGLSGLMFWARVLFGLIAPSIVCLMIWSTVKIRSTQSATGLLYVATVLVLIGELLSKFLLLSTSMPI